MINWFMSYLKDRSQAVVIDKTVSDSFPLPWGTPQGSVKGPLDFVMYTGPVSDVITAHKGIDHAIYADDTQVYLVMRSFEQMDAVKKLEECVADVRAWAIANKLMLNDQKTEVVHFHSRHRKVSPLPELCIGDAKIKASDSARDLGIVLDSTLDLKQHVSNICSAASFGVYKIGRIRKYLNQASTKGLVHAFVTSRLDCNNSLLYGLPMCQLARLQLVQNAAARLVTLTRRREHISPILHDLHWLRIKDRVAFKILLTAYKARHGIAPKYICDLLSVYTPKRNLRSASQLLFEHGPRTKTKYGDCAFAVAAPRLWNYLPRNVRAATTISSFKSKLKTHFFKLN